MPEPITEQALSHIYDETIAELYGYVSRRCGGQRALAEDVTQDTWLRAVREWNRNGLPANPIGWLTTVARNLVYNHFRRAEVVSIDRVAAVDILAAIDTNKVSDSAEIAAIVNKALTRIPGAEAELLETFHYDGHRMSELALSMGISERAVEGRLRRARERLRTELESTMKELRGLA